MRTPVVGLQDRRRGEILEACESLYTKKGFREITIKDISTVTSFSRPSIYNYFKTKEEIFLGLLTREYDVWVEDLGQINGTQDTPLDLEDLADHIAKTLAKRTFLLKVTAMNLYEIEEHSSTERLMEYKTSFKNAVNQMIALLKPYYTGSNEGLQSMIQYEFFPLLYGIYPYTNPTAKQKAAMDAVGIEYQEMSIYRIIYRFLRRLFQTMNEST